MLVEHARTLAGIPDAVHDEYGAGEGTPVVSLLACSLDQQTIEISLAPGSRLAGLHGRGMATERTTCNYGLAPGRGWIASTGGRAVAATDATSEVRAVERPGHPFFIGTLYQPQLTSTPASPHPVWLGFITAAAGLRSRQ